MNYSLEQFEADAASFKPRAFDTYILPAFLMFYAVRSKAGMGKKARRILFTAGVYMTLRNIGTYREAVSYLKERITGPEETI